MPDQALRIAMAAQGHDWLTAHGYAAVGFDHFAIAGRAPLALAAANGLLRRNFQDFTDDDATNLNGMAGSALISLPVLMVANEDTLGQISETSNTRGKERRL